MSALSPEADALLRAVIREEIEKATRPLRDRLEDLDDELQGVLRLLLDTTQVLCRHSPALARKLRDQWKQAEQRRLELLGSTGTHQDDSFLAEPQRSLDVRAQAFRLLTAFGSFRERRPGGKAACCSGAWPALPVPGPAARAWRGRVQKHSWREYPWQMKK